MPFLRERSGDWSPIKIVAFVGSLLPWLWLIYRNIADDLGARPITEMIHFTGDWTVRLLWITLAVTPAARIFKQPKLLLTRRTLGVASACYIFMHFLLYITDQKFQFGTVASEIVLRFYLTIGFIALLGLAALAATSTDGMIRRMGTRWNTLHNTIYVIAILAATHFLLQTKNDVSQPILMAGLLMWLLGYRIMQKRWREVTLVHLTALAVIAAALTAPLETFWYHFRSNVPIDRIFFANFNFSYVIRPMWWVLASGLAVVVLAALWRLRPQSKPAIRKAVVKPSSGATRSQSAS
jgi:sulfoxide reductase heme-binding subunit YedZ